MGIPILWHRFRDLSEATAAAAFGQEGVSFSLPGPRFAQAGGAVSVCFRIGFGPLHKAIGTSVCTDRSLIVHFHGAQAAAVRGALAGFAAEMKVRAHLRYVCWVPAMIVRASGRIVQGIACAMGVGGARFTALAGKLQPGERVVIRFEGMPRALRASVAWHRSRGVAGVEFAGDSGTLAVARRMVTELAAGLWGPQIRVA